MNIPLATEIFRAYDIRGIAEQQILPTTAYAIGQAFAQILKEKNQNRLCVARDARLSGEILEKSLIEGLLASGINVIELGIIASPLLYFATCYLNCPYGIMVTASHNPAEYNGFKFVLDGKPLTPEQIKNLQYRIENNSFSLSDQKGEIVHQNIIPVYLEYIANNIHLERPLTVVVDAGNGVAGHIAPQLYRRLGCTVYELFCELDGAFPNHHPDPSRPENLKDLQEAVVKFNADVGLAFDGDADRLGVVTNEGEIIWPDRQMMLFSKAVLAESPGSSIIFDVKCSKHLGSEIKSAGGIPIMAKTGHSFMKLKLKEMQAALAGEMSGHIFFQHRWFGFDDGIYCGARLLEILSQQTQTSSEIFASLPNAIATPEINISIPEKEKFEFVDKVISAAKDISAEKITLDGLRLEFDDGWALVRASNTAAILVLRFEANDQAALMRIQQQIKTLLLSIKGDLIFPF